MVADWSGTLLEWEASLAGLKARIGAALKRAEAREMASAFIDGLLSGAERKTGAGAAAWTVATGSRSCGPGRAGSDREKPGVVERAGEVPTLPRSPRDA